MSTRRRRRASEVVREVIAETIQKELTDPRLEMITITDVRTTSDLREATVWFAMLRPAQEKGAAAALESARGLIQARLGRELRTRNTPTLRFVADDLSRRAARLTRLIDDATAEADPADGDD